MAVLGDLEQHVMAVLWRAGRPLSVREVHEALHYSRTVAYTTVMTVLDRLAKKGVLERRLEGRAWLYDSRRSCVELHVDEILALLAGCGEGHGRAILAAVEARLGEVAQLGQESCLRTGDPAWTPPARTCSFAAANDCGACPSRAAAS
nr:BlaI/MecI/CopY family transcriptional regulator [Propionibacterium sp.]